MRKFTTLQFEDEQLEIILNAINTIDEIVEEMGDTERECDDTPVLMSTLEDVLDFDDVREQLREVSSTLLHIYNKCL